jgi:hypothetical protein
VLGSVSDVAAADDRSREASMKRALMRWLLFLSFATVATAVGAQVWRATPVDPPIVMSGNDVGFQITGREGATPIGTLVVRIDGRWVPVREAPGTARLAH